MTGPPSDEELPHGPTARDLGEAVAKAAVAGVPVVGGPLAVLASELLSSPMRRRQDAFLKGLGERVNELTDKVQGLSFEALQNDEQFITAVARAGQMALRTHQEAKLEALLNAVENSALTSLDEDVQHMLLSAVDELTPRHLQVLDFFDDPNAFIVRRGAKSNIWSSSPIGELERVLPDIGKNRWLRDQLVRDLHARGLLRDAQLEASRTDSRVRMTTELGRQLLQLVRRPVLGGGEGQ